jgi:transposase InsO family protein
MTGTYKICELCTAFGVKRSSYYAHLHAQANPGPRARANEQLKVEVAEAFHRSSQTYGAPRLQAQLRTTGKPTPSRKRIARLMREQNLNARPRRRYRVRTTDSRHAGPIAAHLLKDKLGPDRPNKIWRSDITYIPTGESWLYLCSFKDAYSRAQVGWAMSDKIDTTLVLSALKMALDQRRPEPGLIIHTDRGSQYASEAYRTAIAKAGAIPSMSRRANCYDNAAMESAWSTLKLERVYRETYKTHAQARASIHDYLCFYNRRRRHSSLGYKSPIDFENQNS